VRIGRVLDPQGDVVLDLLREPRADLPARQEFALAPGERRLVDLERHRDRRLVDLELRQAFGMAARADRVRDAEVVDAAEDDDVPGACRLDGPALEAREAVELAELRVLDAAVAPHD